MRHSSGVGHGGHGHVAVHPAPAAHLPVYGPPPPTIAAQCVRVPGALPALPGGQVLGTGVSKAGVAGSGGVVGGGVAAGGGWGLAQAALVAAGLGLAGAGVSALLPGGGSAPVKAKRSEAPAEVVAPTDVTAPGMPVSFLPLPSLPDSRGIPSSPETGIGDKAGSVPDKPGVSTSDKPVGEGKPELTASPSTVTAVPEPGTVWLLLAGLIGVLGGHRYLRQRAGR